jgi:SAM-dependent methyltransferase
MGLRRWSRRAANRLLRRYGAEIIPTKALYPWQQNIIEEPCFNECELSDAAQRHLRRDNPALLDLQARYRGLHIDVTTHSLWSDLHVREEDLAHFRGDNAWVFQLRGRNSNILAYALSFYYLRSSDCLGLLDKLEEDASFGNFTFTIAGRVVSRDLLDSISELNFLDRQLQLNSRTSIRVLDIGAGYGRLAHRMVQAFNGIEAYYCADAVAVSTFVSEYYLAFRGVQKAKVIPLDQIQAVLGLHYIDLAINIHSFSECRLEAIEWWIRLLSTHGVESLMIAPNRSTSGGQLLLTNDGQDFLPVLERYGYRLIIKQPKYLDPVVQEFGLQPTWYHLFELKGGPTHRSATH